MKNSKIEWCHHSENFWWGCTKVSPACMFCYALVLARIYKAKEVEWRENGKRWLRHEKAGQELHSLAKSAKKAGERHRIFINSMSDTFEDHPGLTEAREWLFTRLEEMGSYGSVDCLLLTKRPENVLRMVPKSWLEAWPAWVWVGTTVEDQRRADQRIPELLKIPARVRFLSCEPLLEAVSFDDLHPFDECPDGSLIHWVICGGESGHGARPMHPDWARSLRDQCKAAGVPFLFKQWGEWYPVNVHGSAVRIDEATIDGKRVTSSAIHDWRDGNISLRVGKNAAGRLLDSVEHNGFPAQNLP